MTGAVPSSAIGWSTAIIPLMISAQERLASEQVESLFAGRYLRINHDPPPGQRALSEMNVVDASMTHTLLALADGAVAAVVSRDASRLERLLS